MRRNELAEIQALPLFSGLRDDSFESLLRGAYVQNFPPQIELIREGDPADFLHVVVEGTVELFASWNGRETTMATVRPIATFILAATIKDGPYLMSARTVEKARIILLPSIDVRNIFETDANFAKAIVLELSQCYRSVIKASKDMKLRNSVERLANYLLKKDIEYGGNGQFDLSIEKRRLASYLGMTAENLSRAIKSLKDYGVEIEGSKVTIKSAETLGSLAKPTPLIDDPAY
jgi:CRP/FNR family transcriptional activator FtrB